MSGVEVVIPVYNEERDLPRSISTLRAFLKEHLDRPWRILIADNGSTDGTLALAQSLSKQYPEVACLHIPQKGRGRALRQAWLESPADITSYMDVDLSTDLAAFPRLLSALDEGCDIAIGSRLLPASQTKRSFKREALSRGYNLIIRASFFISLSDAQCGFKAIKQQAARELIPLVENQNWFFDTELLLLAMKRGYRVKEIPVAWREDPDTRVHVWRTVAEDLRGLARVRWGLLRGRYPPRGVQGNSPAGVPGVSPKP